MPLDDRADDEKAQAEPALVAVRIAAGPAELLEQALILDAWRGNALVLDEEREPTPSRPRPPSGTTKGAHRCG